MINFYALRAFKPFWARRLQLLHFQSRPVPKRVVSGGQIIHTFRNTIRKQNMNAVDLEKYQHKTNHSVITASWVLVVCWKRGHKLWCISICKKMQLFLFVSGTHMELGRFQGCWRIACFVRSPSFVNPMHTNYCMIDYHPIYSRLYKMYILYGGKLNSYSTWIQLCCQYI